MASGFVVSKVQVPGIQINAYREKLKSMLFCFFYYYSFKEKFFPPTLFQSKLCENLQTSLDFMFSIEDR